MEAKKLPYTLADTVGKTEDGKLGHTLADRQAEAMT